MPRFAGRADPPQKASRIPGHQLLIAMAFDAAAGQQGGVTALAKAALQAGATTSEIAETLRVAYHLTGVGTLYTASRGLKEVIQKD